MNATWVLLPLAIATSSLLLLGARKQFVSAVGFVLLFGGIAGMFGVAYSSAAADQNEAANCAARGGVPVNGDCWIGGEKR